MNPRGHDRQPGLDGVVVTDLDGASRGRNASAEVAARPEEIAASLDGVSPAK